MSQVVGYRTAFSDIAIENAIRHLIAERPDDYITYGQIAKLSGTNVRTIKRYMKRVGSSRFTRIGGRRTGFQYKFK